MGRKKSSNRSSNSKEGNSKSSNRENSNAAGYMEVQLVQLQKLESTVHRDDISSICRVRQKKHSGVSRVDMQPCVVESRRPVVIRKCKAPGTSSEAFATGEEKKFSALLQRDKDVSQVKGALKKKDAPAEKR